MNSSDEESKHVYGEFFGILLMDHSKHNFKNKYLIFKHNYFIFFLNNYFYLLTFLIIISYLF
jgi:hypothetical protein